MMSIWICIFTLLLKLQFLEGKLGQELNPGSEIDFYGPNQKSTRLTPVKDFFAAAKSRDCKKAPKNSSCIVDHFFNDPNLPCDLAKNVICNPFHRYRQIDGKCNNPLAAKIGKSGVCFLRFIAPVYDGHGGIRKAMSGAPLPEPREISLQIFKNYTRLDDNVTFLYVQFGQLIAHDLVRAVKPPNIDCCAPENSKKPECLPIKVSSDDPYYSKLNKTCLNFIRTEECKFCTAATRAQTNGATAAMDLSIIYGENDEMAKKLRAFNKTGELKLTRSGYLPIVGVDKEDEFCPKGQESECLLTGDPRVNMHAALGSLQTVWMREHNRIAKKMKKINPCWNDEEIYQEARKLNIAEFQCIAYKYFYPPLLSNRVMEGFGTNIKDGPDGTTYDPAVALEVWNEYAVASFRLHSMVAKETGFGNLKFRDLFSAPQLIRHGKTTDLLKGASCVPMESYDRYLVDDLSKYLYKKELDLVSINIQRGRDHGLAPYVEAIPFCSGQSMKVEKFEDLWKLDLMTFENAELLSKVYEHVEDIDMWVGMNMEKRMNGSLLGPTAACINGKQCYFTFYGDKYFFTHKGIYAPFTPEQRAELKEKCSFARILCDNTRIRELNITKNPFFLPSDENPEVQCKKIPKLNLSIFNGPRKCHEKKPEIPAISTLSPDVSNHKEGLPV